MFYIFHGEDDLTRNEKLAGMLAQMGDAAMAELNTTYLDGKNLTLGQLREVCDSLPMFAERRVVIVTNHLSRFGVAEKGKGKDGNKELTKALKEEAAALADYLTRLSGSLRLFLLEDKELVPKNPLLKLAQKEKDGIVEHFAVPKPNDLIAWIVKRVKHRGGLIAGDAAHALALAVGQEPRLIDSEIVKLITYIGSDAPLITLQHIDLLVPYSGETNVFTLVDSIGRRDVRAALKMLHKLVITGKPDEWLPTLGMIIRQFRILIQVKEMSGQGLAQAAIATRTGLHPYVAEKALGQSKNFSMRQLEAIYDRLLETDLDIKTGKMDAVLALDTLVVALCGPPD